MTHLCAVSAMSLDKWHISPPVTDDRKTGKGTEIKIKSHKKNRRGEGTSPSCQARAGLDVSHCGKGFISLGYLMFRRLLICFRTSRMKVVNKFFWAMNSFLTM
jgi:hypothetical protein